MNSAKSKPMKTPKRQKKAKRFIFKQSTTPVRESNNTLMYTKSPITPQFEKPK